MTDGAASRTHQPPRSHRWRGSSVGLICLLWAVLHIGGLWSPGLLDDVDSIYIEVAREMLGRHDFVTPVVDGIRFFDKPPLMYWAAAGSMRVFGQYDWAARLPLALATLALLLATYGLGLRLFAQTSPTGHLDTPDNPDRGAFYAALALGTAIGPYLYTRFFIPDILLTLWMVLGVHLFLIGLERARLHGFRSETRQAFWSSASPLLPMAGFAAVLAANVLTKGLIGLVLPLGFVVLYMAFSRQIHLLPRLYPAATILIFLLLAAPWHILVALRNPAIPLPPGLGLPSHGGWAWFYLYNEHIARFLSRRIPHDYGQVPLLAFWALAALWIFPWVAFLPSAVLGQVRQLRSPSTTSSRQHEAALTCLLWTSVVLGFFSFSARQEYYSLPALPALALVIGGYLASADAANREPDRETKRAATLRSYTYFLLPLTIACAAIAIYLAIAAGHVDARTDVTDLLANDRSGYNLSLGHMFDLTQRAMGLFRGSLAVFAIAMLGIGPASWWLRHSSRAHAANLTLAASAAVLLLAIHGGLARFYPKLGSKALADAIVREQTLHPRPDDLILIDGELTDGSTLLFYCRQPVHLVDGRVNGPWYGSFWPDAPPIFETAQRLHQQWASQRRLFLLTPNARARTEDLLPFGEVHPIAQAGGKVILSNEP